MNRRKLSLIAKWRKRAAYYAKNGIQGRLSIPVGECADELEAALAQQAQPCGHNGGRDHYSETHSRCWKCGDLLPYDQQAQPLTDEAFDEWFADVPPPAGCAEPVDLVPYHFAKQAWIECRDRMAQHAQPEPVDRLIAAMEKAVSDLKQSHVRIDPATITALRRAIMPAAGKVLEGPDVALIQALIDDPKPTCDGSCWWGAPHGGECTLTGELQQAQPERCTATVSRLDGMTTYRHVPCGHIIPCPFHF